MCDIIKEHASNMEKQGLPLNLLAPLRGASKLRQCVQSMLDHLNAKRAEVPGLPIFASEVRMGPILAKGNQPLARFLRDTAPGFTEALKLYQGQGTKLVNCMVGGGINVAGVPELIRGVLNAGCPPGYDVIEAPHASVGQVARGCIIYRMFQVGHNTAGFMC